MKNHFQSGVSLFDFLEKVIKFGDSDSLSTGSSTQSCIFSRHNATLSKRKSIATNSRTFFENTTALNVRWNTISSIKPQTMPVNIEPYKYCLEQCMAYLDGVPYAKGHKFPPERLNQLTAN